MRDEANGNAAWKGPFFLDDLLESTVDGGSDSVALVEIDGCDSTLADAFGGELELLEKIC